MVYRPPYPWYIDPLTHGISTLLPMVYRPPNPWNVDPPAHGISTPLPIVYQTLSYGIMNSSLLVEMRGVQFTMRGFKIQLQKIAPGVKIYGKLNPDQNIICKFTMGFKIPYDTGCKPHVLG